MIRIKNYIFNENRIVQMCINENNNLEIDTDNSFPIVIKDVKFDDIEWNYENNNEYCNVFYEDRIKELEEENKTLKESLGEMTKRNVKATVYIEKNSSAFNGEEEHLDKVYTILKGEENEN